MYTVGACLVLGLVMCDGSPQESCQEQDEDILEEKQLLQGRKDTMEEVKQISQDPSVWIGPNDFHEHHSVCTEEKSGYYCDKYSGNPENRLNDKDPNHWAYVAHHYDVYRSTAICAKRTGNIKTWDHHLKITCRAREMGNWDQKAYWDKIHYQHHRYFDEYDPNSPWVDKELFIGPNKYGKESICIEEREGWECDPTHDEGWHDTFEIYRSNPVCAKILAERPDIYRWTQHLNIPCMAGITGCGNTNLKQKSPTYPLVRTSGSCQRQGDCVSSMNYPQNYGTHDECTFYLETDASVCRLGNFGIQPGGPYFKIKPRSEMWGNGDYHNIDSPIAMPPELKSLDSFEWLVRGSQPQMGWQFCFKPQ